MDKSADEMCATVRITHSFFAAAAKLPLRGDGILFHVKHGTRKCRDVGFRWNALVGPGASRPLSWKRGKLPKSDVPTGGSGLHRPGSTGVGAKGPWLRPARGAAAGPKHRSSDAGSLSQDQPEGRFARHPAQCGEAAEAARPARVLPLKGVSGRCPVSPDGRRGTRRQAG